MKPYQLLIMLAEQWTSRISQSFRWTPKSRSSWRWGKKSSCLRWKMNSSTQRANHLMVANLSKSPNRLLPNNSKPISRCSLQRQALSELKAKIRAEWLDHPVVCKYHKVCFKNCNMRFRDCALKTQKLGTGRSLRSEISKMLFLKTKHCIRSWKT